MRPSKPLPVPEEWTNPDAYVEALLSFATSSDLFRHLCGGVHMLDFLTREPDLYTSLLPEHWRVFFDQHDLQDVIDLMLRDDIEPLLTAHKQGNDTETQGWKGAGLPPLDLLEYIQQIRRLSLHRDFTPQEAGTPSIPRRIAVGMKVKKYHEVAHFSKYVDTLCNTVNKERGEDITHIVDFGSGQSYLGRTLASPPYNRHIVAIERKHQFISGANRMDIYAKLREKKKVQLYNKKLATCTTCEEPEAPAAGNSDSMRPREPETSNLDVDDSNETPEDDEESLTEINIFRNIDIAQGEVGSPPARNGVIEKPAANTSTPRGAMDYIEHEIKDGYLEPIIENVIATPLATINPVGTTERTERPTDARVMVVSLHSCGNLLHHGIRALTLNPSVKAIAMIGCCYNLVTERLGPAAFKLPVLRSMHARLSQDASAFDPHGFPMSKRLEVFEHGSGTGVKLNVTARSMAVQAPYNWGRVDSDDFFTRHFYRSLLQRVLVDRKVIAKPGVPKDLYSNNPEDSEAIKNPLIVGSLRKSAFDSFTAYARAAVAKLGRDPYFGPKVRDGMANISDEELERYVTEYWPAKKKLSVTWTLMSFSAALVEAIIVVDRWQFLRENDSVKDCWVESVFDYGESPRNLAVIGIKK
ncbi:hypothetical protein P175DRAFT_0459287 [Aspergillus ochraceoroseus IBT 24754]|uniref:Methyltransferase domain-containing protein n=2 Tax=Aspergillus ochraceoroseus TaxID=138278 RepID=A0A2T5LXU4_9EURO|nr:uncharacterized protein P175DRAFT_0459287 [Aspergillus ochraceoroseus IBT 24754]KKK15797.1 hypothetical protein AOCH_001679 [Aspergillus ochraceoroseus]PTU21108.1 hypothetical protein P175DRAFT_0459287 [Aspergillus ochraceoroseus IBT 24754]